MKASGMNLKYPLTHTRSCQQCSAHVFCALELLVTTKHLHSFSVLDDQQNVRPIKELLQTLYASLCSLVQDMGKSVLVGNINIWVHRMENILLWQQQLDNIQINRVSAKAPDNIAKEKLILLQFKG